ncbi:hypothetical protein [Micromonospora sp. 4G55]|uniref:hypothetical protein n=1 Tax=Micromonospora sp. 4G55 TaxID=2806102 RepID=UPI001A5ACB60|nr:hypothetical protein [Micromonospora sp. 4G55]MBM0256353.1 hypothetical protein [Micromonospora sp. 4G55]
MPISNTVCDAAALVPATATTQAHVHRCNRYVFADCVTHVGMHHCAGCGADFTVSPVSAPTATEKCEACGAVQPLTNLREMYPEPDVTQYLCIDNVACSARVMGHITVPGMPAGIWPATTSRRGDRGERSNLYSLPAAPPPQHDPAEVDPGLREAYALVRDIRDMIERQGPDNAVRTTVRQRLTQLERELAGYRPPTAELVEMTLEPGVVDDLTKRVIELERAVANLIQERCTPAPPARAGVKV